MMFSINFPRCYWTFRELPSTCCASAGHSVNFSCIHRALHQLSVRLRNIPENFMQLPDLLSTSVNFLCICETFHLLSVHLQIFYQIPSAFCVRGNSVNFRQLSIRPRDYPLTFCVSAGHTVNFSELPCGRGTFRQLSVHLQDLPSTFGVYAAISVNFLCVRGTFCQLFVRPWDLPPPSVNSSCVLGTFCQYFVHPWDLPKTIRTADGPSVNFSQLTVLLRDSVNFPCNDGTYCQLSMHPRDLPSTFHTSAGYSV